MNNKKKNLNLCILKELIPNILFVNKLQFAHALVILIKILLS